MKLLKSLKVLVARSMAWYHGPCEDDLEMATGGNRLEKSYYDFISLTNLKGIRFQPNPITVALFSVAHSQFSNNRNFIKKYIIGPDLLKSTHICIVANRQACRYNPFVESADK